MFFITRKEKYIKTNIFFKYFKYLILFSSKDISFIKKKYSSFFLINNIIKIKKSQILKNIVIKFNLNILSIGFSYLYATNNIYDYLKLFMSLFYFEKNKIINLIYIIRQNFVIDKNIILRNFKYYINNIYFFNIFLFNLIGNIYLLYLINTLNKYLIINEFYQII